MFARIYQIIKNVIGQLLPCHYPDTSSYNIFIYWIYALRKRNTEEMELSKLGWETLQERRKQARINMMLKIQHKLVGIDKDLYTSPATDYTGAEEVTA